MYLEKLQIRGIRNLKEAVLDLSPRINLIVGLNGSGKTSILEAAHILSRGRSFRTRNLRSVINLDERTCTCFGMIHPGHPGGHRTPVGVQRDDRGKFVFKVNGKQVNTASQLAEALPVQIVNADSFQLLEGAPGARRGFIDWGVFHVEHSYRDIWSRFQKCLKHRNSLLRHGKIDRLQMTVWDREFCSLAARIDAYRRRYLDELIGTLQDILVPLELAGDFSFRYANGWDDRESLEGQLESAWMRDRKAGFTHFGPHRADLKILVGKQQAAEVLSRGQTKTLVFGLKLAQGTVFQQKTGEKCIFLLDDLASELDVAHRAAVCRLLWEMGVQVLVTGINPDDLTDLWPEATERPRMFHVEQGRIVKVEDHTRLDSV